MSKASCTIPVIFQQKINDIMISKATLVLSNAPGPRIQTEICGSKLLSGIGFPPFLGSLGVGICTNTIADAITICITADTALVSKEDTKKIMRLYESHFERFLAGEWEPEFGIKQS